MLLKRSTQQISTTLSGESIILNHQKGAYYALNEVGTYIWEQIKDEPVKKEDLVSRVSEYFEVDTVDCETDITELIDALLDEKLLEIVA